MNTICKLPLGVNDFLCFVIFSVMTVAWDKSTQFGDKHIRLKRKQTRENFHT